MITLKALYKKTRKGGVVKVLREHYLRDDIGCGIKICQACKKIQPKCPLFWEDQPGPQLLVIIDITVAIQQVDLLEEDAIKSVVICQTVLEETKYRSPPAYKKLKDMIANPQKQFFVHSNEFHKGTFVKRVPQESANERSDRAIRALAAWYKGHVDEINSSNSASEPPKKKKKKEDGTSSISTIDLIFVSDDKDNLEEAKKSGIESLTTREFVMKYLMKEYPHLIDKLAASPTSDSSTPLKQGGFEFPEHKFLSELSIGLKSGQYKQGSLQISRDNYLEAFIYVDGLEEPIFVQGLMNINRGVHGDVVAIEMLPEDEWTAPANVLKIAEMEEQQDKGDELKEGEDEEIVKAVPIVTKENRLPTGRVIGIVKRNWRPYCGILQKSPAKDSTRHLFIPSERRVPRVRIETRQSERLQSRRIVVSIDSWPKNSRYPLGHYVRDLGELGDRSTENEVLLLEHDVPHHAFSQAVLDCLPETPWRIKAEEYEEREDLRHLDICSVDPPGCTDIDDALHCRELGNGHLEAGVHIADVTHFVRPGTAMDIEASSRGTTVYLVDNRIDMLPELLSSNLCSLRGGEERFAFSVIWELTPEGEIMKTRFCKSVIKSRNAFTYAEAQLRIDDSSQRDLVSEGLRRLNRVAKLLKAKRKAAGALTLASLEIRFNVDSETHDPIDVQAKQVLETNSMVEEFMLLANISVAKHIREEFPECAVLRRHPVPAPANFKPILQAAGLRGIKLQIDNGKALSRSLDEAVVKENPYFNTMLRVLTTRCMTQAVYFCSGTIEDPLYLHYGLAAPIYTHFTSPIRRYADVLVHRLLGASIHADKTYPELLNKQKIQNLCNNLNYRHKMAQYAGRASVFLNTHLFFKDKVEILEGYILAIRQNAFQVLMPKYGLESAISVTKFGKFIFNVEEGTLSDGKVTLHMFDPVTVRVMKRLMRAIRVREFGGPDVLKMEEGVPIPDCLPSQILIKVLAVGVNPVETYIRAGVYPRKPELPYVPGSDCAGVVEKVGADVQGRWKEGDRVFTTLKVLSGAYAEYCVVDPVGLFPLPEALTYSQGAAIGVPYFTAFRALVQRCKARSGESVLVHGASGAVGLATCQLANALGLHVIGTAGSAEGMDLVTKNGAKCAFNHKDEGYLKKISEATNHAGLDIIIEMLSNVNLGKDLPLLSPGGRVGIVGSRGTVEINPRDLMSKESSVLGVQLAKTSDAEVGEIGAEILKGIEKGWLRPVVAKEYPLKEAAQAHIDVINPGVGAKGKLILVT